MTDQLFLLQPVDNQQLPPWFVACCQIIWRNKTAEERAKAVEEMCSKSEERSRDPSKDPWVVPPLIVDVTNRVYGELTFDPFALRGSIDREDAMTVDEARRAFSLGVALADEEIDAGADLLIIGDMGIGNTTTAAAITGLLAPADLLSVVGRGTGIDDATWMRKAAAVRDAMRRGKPHKGTPLELLATIGGPDIATMVGLLLGAAARRTPVILDGTVISAAALIAHRVAYKSRDWWQAGHRSTEPAHSAALGRLDLTPLLDLKMRLGEGTGALLTIPLVASAAAALSEMLTFEEAGVSTAEEPTE